MSAPQMTSSDYRRAFQNLREEEQQLRRQTHEKELDLFRRMAEEIRLARQQLGLSASKVAGRISGKLGRGVVLSVEHYVAIEDGELRDLELSLGVLKELDIWLAALVIECGEVSP